MSEMNNIVQVLNIQIHNIKTARAMKQVQQYLQSESLNTIEIVSMDTLLRAEEELKLQESVNRFDLIIPGDKEILKAAGITNAAALHDAENGVFWNNLARMLDKRKTKIYLLTDSEAELQRISEYIQKHYHGIRVRGQGILAEDTLSDELVVNNINAAGVDCVLGFLTSPVREYFVTDNHALLNAKVWVGISRSAIGQEVSSGNRFRMMIMRLLFHRKVVQEKKDLEEK